MTREKALFELCELAGTVIHASHDAVQWPPELFYWAEHFKDEALIQDSSISGQTWSKDYERCHEWLMSKC